MKQMDRGAHLPRHGPPLGTTAALNSEDPRMIIRSRLAIHTAILVFRSPTRILTGRMRDMLADLWPQYGLTVVTPLLDSFT